MISETAARRLVLERYRQLFTQLYLRDDATGKYHAFPPLEEAAFQVVSQDEAAWIVRAAPAAGVEVDARVGKRGEWIDVKSIGYSDE